MNTLTRGEKIDRALENAKAIVVKVTIIAWAFLTMALGVSLGMERANNESLREQIRVLKEEQKNFELGEDVKTVYIYRK